MDAWEKFKKTIERDVPLRAGDRVILAVSGGPDSVCLLHLFWRLRKTLPLELTVVHLDHGLRTEARSEALLIRELGERFAVPVVVEALPVRAHARERKISIETAGRELRYEAFRREALKRSCRLIATGHTANDNAETVLMWLIRGTGLEGLAGIPMARPLEKGVSVIRPLLPVTRTEIIGYLKRQKVPYCMDASNESLDYTRNRIRHGVVPVLEQYNPRFVEHAYNLSRIVCRENRFLEETAARAARRAVTIKKDRILLDLKRFFRYNKVVQLRMLKEVLPEKRSLSTIDHLFEWVHAASQKTMTISRRWRAEKRGASLVFLRTEHHGED